MNKILGLLILFYTIFIGAFCGVLAGITDQTYILLLGLFQFSLTYIYLNLEDLI